MEVLISAADIQRRVCELGNQIARDHPDSTPLLVGVLNGCILFIADLMKAIPVPHEIDFVSVSSYRDASESNRKPRLLKDLEKEIRGRDVVLVEDIVDSGHTLAFLREALLARGPRRVRIVSLLDKRSRREREVPLDYVGFPVPDRFVVGYGLDYAERFRHLPYIAALSEAEIAAEGAARKAGAA
ncbi:MAG: hypoxanthine phosphoribosyltransferase [Hyphomicrobiales bacterium]